jgi:DNA-binding LytR/AlgR family response regulator
VKALIIEDEPRAASRLQKLLHEVEPDLEVVATLETVVDSISFLASKPEIDLIFSDIQLADDVSFKIYSQVSVDVPIIFTTAYDAYAIDAFKTNGIDYLLKPISAEDLHNALKKYKQLLGKKSSPENDLKALAALLSNQNPGKEEYKKRFMVRVGTHLKSIPAADVVVAYSKNKATYLLTKQKRSYPVETSLDTLQEQLDPQRFFRINRGFIISLEAQPEISAYSNSRLKLAIPGLEEELIIVARERTKEFKVWLGE